MQNKPRLRFWAAIAIQVAILLGMVGMHSYTLATGQPVRLQTAPVDPWDPFRGEYVYLNYAISRLGTDQMPMDGAPYRQGQRVWVTLRKGEPYWTAVKVSAAKPQTGPDEVVLRARVQWTQPYDYTKEGLTEGDLPGWLVLRYGIEQFYVPEGQGQALQGQMADLSVEAVVDSQGRAALRQVFLEGQPIQWR